MKQKEKTLLTTKHFLLVLALIVCVNFLFSEVLPVQPPSGNSHLSVPFTIKGTVSPDKKYYEKDEIVSFSGYIKLNREHIMYIPDKQYHVRTNCFTGYRTRKLEILNSNMDSLFVMDDINDSLFISATAKVTKLTALVDICFNVSRIGYNSSVQHYIDKGIILNPHDPEVIWALQHDEQDFDGISNTSPMSGRHLKKKNYPHSKLETSRLPHNLMYNSELRLWFYHFEHPEAVEIVSLSVDDYGAFYGENSQYAPEIVDDTLMVVHSTNAIGSTGTVFFTYLYDNVEYYYDYEFYIRGSIDIEITFGYEEDDIENFHAGMGRVNIYRCNESNFYDAFEYDSQYLETPGEPYESYDILPNNNQNTCTIDISDFDRGFVGFEIEFQKDFFQLLEQPEDQDNCHPDQWINKKYWVILYHPEVYYSSSYNGNVYLYINFINDEENNYAEHVPNNCGMIYLHDKDVCGAFNVIRQIDRAEDFSTSY
nr:hypothetical protein [Candidatus Cloacimonadota bacterium]